MIKIYDVFQIIKDCQTLLASFLLPALSVYFYRWNIKINHKQEKIREKVRHDYRMEELRIKGQINKININKNKKEQTR